jgi:hypothetical protein
MTDERSQAYGRVLGLLDEAPELQRTECDLFRSAADALLFAQAPDTETFEAVSEARALAHSLVDSGRCRMELAAALLAALRSCGPEGMPASMTSLRNQRFSRHPFWSRAGR